jgi:hypothetical protein
MKVERKAITIVLIFIMFLSTFAYSFILNFNYSNTNKSESLPNERIVSSISENQKILAISNGFTLIYFNYTSPNHEIKYYLESLITNYNVYLVENLSNENSLKIESLRGSREIKEPNINQTIDLLCQVMIDKPIDCVMREIE